MKFLRGRSWDVRYACRHLEGNWRFTTNQHNVFISAMEAAKWVIWDDEDISGAFKLILIARIKRNQNIYN